ncbi:MAG: aromatic ring-hydroxylating oxygenase subunit alpha [Aestuariivirga sp.]|uniref:aromatic ring-hydroxylating oxygenase subunit alpha n=1 Tax=Aestuariivirga sp. TaxID=2650926 RepID=UPI0038CFE38D
MTIHPLSPRLDHCPESLPRDAYIDPDWFTRELETVFARQWLCAGRLGDFPKGTLRRRTLGNAPVIVIHGEGGLSAYHNVCRHRGAELCAEDRTAGRLITCPYHAWSYSAADGKLVATGPAKPTADFDPSSHGLLPVAVRIWQGFVFLNAGPAPAPLTADVPLAALDNWPIAALQVGHRWEKEVACNWKVFWENYSECLHCPGIHPELCDMVPIYGEGIMGASEALGWTPEQPVRPNLRDGAESWTPDGKPCGPMFPALTDEERRRGYSFVTIWPSLYVVAHADYVRAVRIEPMSPRRTRLTVEWYFPEITLAQPGFDAGRVASFARTVLAQDGAAAEMNQRGLASPAFTRGRLMPEEYELHRFHRWLLKAMGEAA